MQYDDRSHAKFTGLPMLKKDLRGLCPPIPDNVMYDLNEIQCIALGSLEHFGWSLAFIRRSLLPSPIIVVKHKVHTKFAVLEEDGSVNLSPVVRWRH